MPHELSLLEERIAFGEARLGMYAAYLRGLSSADGQSLAIRVAMRHQDEVLRMLYGQRRQLFREMDSESERRGW